MNKGSQQQLYMYMFIYTNYDQIAKGAYILLCLVIIECGIASTDIKIKCTICHYYFTEKLGHLSDENIMCDF